MRDGGTQEKRSIIEALAEGMEGTAELADTHLLAGLLNHSPAKEDLVQRPPGSPGRSYPVAKRSLETA